MKGRLRTQPDPQLLAHRRTNITPPQAHRQRTQKLAPARGYVMPRKMTSARLFLTFCSAVAFTLSCGADAPPSEAQLLWQRIQNENYHTFQRAPGHDTRQPSNTAHAEAVDIYINSVMANAIAAGNPIDTWPADSLVIKEGYTTDGTLDSIAVINKRQHGWYWAKYIEFETGNAVASGTPFNCIGCHNSGDDFIRSFDFPH